jgi:hypothetical protein
MHRNYDYLYFLKESYFSLNSFLFLFYKNKVMHNFFLSYFFKTAINNYKKGFFLNVRPYVYTKLFKFIKLFRKLYKKNKKTRKRIFKVFLKYSRPKYKYIKHSKNYKGKKNLRKIELPKKRINLNTKFFRTLHYKRNKILPFLIRRNLDIDKNIKFFKLYNFINNLSVTGRRIHKGIFLLKTAKISIFLNFNKHVKKFNLNYSKSNIKRNFLKNVLNNSLDLKFNDNFFKNFTKSIYRFDSLISRYNNYYFLRLNELRKDDLFKIKLLKKQRKSIKDLGVTENELSFLKYRIDKDLGYLFLRSKAYLIYRKKLRSIKGISHYFLLGNNILNLTFSNKFWLYLKKNFYFPSFFYLNLKFQKFKIFKSLYKSSLHKKYIIKNNNISYYFYSNYFRVFSLYNKYFYSYYISNFPFYQKLLTRYNKTHKKVF